MSMHAGCETELKLELVLVGGFCGERWHESEQGQFQWWGYVSIKKGGDSERKKAEEEAGNRLQARHDHECTCGKKIATY